MKIILATNNPGKIREFQQIFQAFPIEFITQASCHVSEIEETGCSFIENAILKARHAAVETGYAAIADDSGLVIPVLNGEPGVYSARYAGEPSNDRANINKVLEKMRDIPEEKRNAFFYCALVYLSHAHDPTPLIACGQWHGKILFEPKGEKGFGYDPIFYVPTHQCSAAELTPEEKNQRSHRGLATQELKRLFQQHGHDNHA